MTDAHEALAQVREALVNEALFDPGASTADTYSACKAFGTACTPENVRAILAHVEAQAAEIERLTFDNEQLRDMLARLYAGSALYSDDGELQDARAEPFIDFKRDSVADIRCAMVERGEQR